MKKNNCFALYFGNRGFFPETLIAEARKEVAEVLKDKNLDSISLDASLTRYGAVETAAEGKIFAEFLKKNEGKFEGVILCLPNFGDETGAVAALQDAGVPILILAYPDLLNKMGFEERRDAFCGKFSIMDMFYQYNIPFTVFPPHAVHPKSKEFKKQLACFVSVCNVVKGMKRFTVGAIGARTTAFKTVRIDELALQKAGITTETIDLSEIFIRMKSASESSKAFKSRSEFLKKYSDFSLVPKEQFVSLVKLSVIIDELIAEFSLDALSVRCWLELEKEYKIAPCVLLSELNNRGIAAACELDTGNAIMMHALKLASGKPATCLDWNNNYGEDIDKCILFHCGPVPADYMTKKGKVIDHPMFSKALGAGCGFGPNVGRIKPMPLTFASCKTENGELYCYLGEGKFTDDKIADNFFGCAGVAEISKLQDKLLTIGKNGYRHHVSVTAGHVGIAVKEAFTTYLKYKLIDI